MGNMKQCWKCWRDVLWACLCVLLLGLAVNTPIASSASDLSDLPAAEVQVRDQHLIKAFANMRVELTGMTDVRIRVRKSRGYKRSNMTWGNEQWSYILAVPNDDSEKASFNATLAYYDADGLRLASSFVYIKSIPPRSTAEADGFLYFDLDYINRVETIRLIGEGLVQE